MSTLLKIARMGHPVLRMPASPLGPAGARAARGLAEAMAATMIDARGVGLAAPQVHEPLRLFLMRLGDGIQAFADPVITPLDAAVETGFEGCLSIPGLRGLVPRWRRIRLDALGLDGEPIALELDGFPARVVQHEVDHLDGILYLDRMTDLRMLAFEEEMRHLVGSGGGGTEDGHGG